MNPLGAQVDYIAAFIGGIFISFTPCVFPIIPISATYIGVRASGSKLKGLILSLVYVTGIACAYSFLGILASLTGSFFGKISSHPLTYIIVGIIIILFGLSMLDLFVINFPGIARLPKFKRQNYFSTFLLGLSSGLIISPCLTPVLGSILGYLATKRNMLYGATLLFSFAYGMGLIFILVGTFSVGVLGLGGLQKQMNLIKKLFSFILIGLGLYFVYSGLRRL